MASIPKNGLKMFSCAWTTWNYPQSIRSFPTAGKRLKYFWPRIDFHQNRKCLLYVLERRDTVRNRLGYGILKDWKKPERKRKNLIRLGVDYHHAYAWSRTRKGGWAIAQLSEEVSRVPINNSWTSNHLFSQPRLHLNAEQNAAMNPCSTTT